MLVIKNLSKTYSPKKGVPIKALDDISLNFEDKGMVVILGKSGSGKSTLLNMLGGLDTYDEGEIEIYGKSSKNFSQADFDSYRNNYVGFIFQEYNLLDQFTVGQNIALALELQRKKSTNEIINETLKEVDLEGFFDRKPNELSVGQLQRVAIARALVKNPQFILADEPTGALDSVTGLQIFDTLKKISKEKLVIVVSHDRELAEQYADRIIELKDGKVISDVVKQVDEKDNIFFSTNCNERTSNIKNDNAFNKSKSALPYKNSAKMALSNLRVKTFRLIITILLSVFAFSLFGIVATFADYHNYTVMSNTIIDNNIGYLNIQNNRFDFSMNRPRNPILNEDVDYFTAKYPEAKFLKVYCGNFGSIGINNLNTLKLSTSNYYSTNGRFTGLAEIQTSKEEFLSTYGFTLIGELPNKDNEIALTKYIYEHFKKCGLQDSDNWDNCLKIENESDLIGKKIGISADFLSGNYLVTGIIDTKLNDSEFIKYKNTFATSEIERIALETFTSDIQFGYHALGFVNNNLISNHQIDKTIYDLTSINLFIDGKNFREINYQWNKVTTYTDKVANSDKYKKIFFDDDKTELTDNEILVPVNLFDNRLDYYIYNEIIDYCYNIENVPQEIKSMSQAELNAKFDLDEDNPYYCENTIPSNDDYSTAYKNWMLFSDYYSIEYSDKLSIIKEISDKEIQKVITEKKNETHDIVLQLNGNEKNLKIAGCFLNVQSKEDLSNSRNYYSEKFDIVISEEMMNELGLESCRVYSYLIGKMPTAQKEIQDLSKIVFTYSVNGENYLILNSATANVRNIDNNIVPIIKLFLYIGIGLAVFAMVFLMFYISTSITHKKKEIGILRALGARGIDIFGIFFNEALFIAVINFVLSVIASLCGVLYTNSFIRTEFNLNVTVFHFGMLQILLLLGISILAAILASFPPVCLISKKRPIEAIRNR